MAQGDRLRKCPWRPRNRSVAMEKVESQGRFSPFLLLSIHLPTHPHPYTTPSAADLVLEWGRTVSDNQNLPFLEARDGNGDADLFENV